MRLSSNRHVGNYGVRCSRVRKGHQVKLATPVSSAEQRSGKLHHSVLNSEEPAMNPHPEISLLVTALDEAFDRRSWHGTNLLGSLRNVSAPQAIWHPADGRHNIWEIAVHAAYWKYAVWRVITGVPRGSFPLKGSNWFERATADDAAWHAELRLLKDQHLALREAVLALPPRRIHELVPRKKVHLAFVIRGAAAHDLYHAGQIQLLKRLLPG